MHVRAQEKEQQGENRIKLRTIISTSDTLIHMKVFTEHNYRYQTLPVVVCVCEEDDIP